MNSSVTEYKSTTNPCKVCAPLGASLAVKGIRGGMSILHGSQGCATYIRRYMISHFKEPLDIASSSFDESSAIFGGKKNLKAAISNVSSQYHPEIIGITATCLSETIGEDIGSYLRECEDCTDALLVPITIPSFTGAHLDGYYAAVHSILKGVKPAEIKEQSVNIFPSMVSAADLRYLKSLPEAFGLRGMTMPDFSRTLDGGIWGEYLPISPGGTPLEKIAAAPLADLSISFSPFLREELSAPHWLEENHGVEHHSLFPPIGVRGTDALMKLLAEKSGGDVPTYYAEERARVIDAYADCHKYIFGKKALVFGDADFVAGISAFLDEIGIIPLICACGTPFPGFKEYIAASLENSTPELVQDDVDFKTLEEWLKDMDVDLMIGNSKGYSLSRKKNIPLVRGGFPIHDRVGGPRILHVGYAGAVNLLDTIVNTILYKRQEESSIGYSYL